LLGCLEVATVWTRKCYDWVVTSTRNWLLSNSLINAYKVIINMQAEHSVLVHDQSERNTSDYKDSLYTGVEGNESMY